MAMVNASSLSRNHGEVIDKNDQRHNSYDQPIHRESQPTYRRHDSREEVLPAPELWTLDWRLPSRKFNDDRVNGMRTRRHLREYERVDNHGIRIAHSGRDVHSQYDRHTSNHHGGSYGSHDRPIAHYEGGYGSHNRPINTHGGGYGTGGRYAPHYASASRYDRKY